MFKSSVRVLLSHFSTLDNADVAVGVQLSHDGKIRYHEHLNSSSLSQGPPPPFLQFTDTFEVDPNTLVGLKEKSFSSFFKF